MKCPKCQHEGKALVVETRRHEGSIYRRRGCSFCGASFVSVESAPPGLKMPDEVRHSRARGQLDIEKYNEKRRLTNTKMKPDFSRLKKFW